MNSDILFWGVLGLLVTLWAMIIIGFIYRLRSASTQLVAPASTAATAQPTARPLQLWKLLLFPILLPLGLASGIGHYFAKGNNQRAVLGWIGIVTVTTVYCIILFVNVRTYNAAPYAESIRKELSSQQAPSVFTSTYMPKAKDFYSDTQTVAQPKVVAQSSDQTPQPWYIWQPFILIGVGIILLPLLWVGVLVYWILSWREEALLLLKASLERLREKWASRDTTIRPAGRIFGRNTQPTVEPTHIIGATGGAALAVVAPGVVPVAAEKTKGNVFHFLTSALAVEEIIEYTIKFVDWIIKRNKK